MFALHAAYRGRRKRRAAFVAQVAEVLGEFEGAGPFSTEGVEHLHAPIASAEALVDVAMALLAGGEWAVGLGMSESPELAAQLAAAAVDPKDKAGHTALNVDPLLHNKEAIADVIAVFELLRFVMAKRSFEGQEATSYLRRGFTQTEAAAELGITKQAMSQRLQAAGWKAEKQGRTLAIHLIENLR